MFSIKILDILIEIPSFSFEVLGIAKICDNGIPYILESDVHALLTPSFGSNLPVLLGGYIRTSIRFFLDDWSVKTF